MERSPFVLSRRQVVQGVGMVGLQTSLEYGCHRLALGVTGKLGWVPA
jgi:hypothetical protein